MSAPDHPERQAGSGLILPHRDKLPRIDPAAFIAPNATIIGDVEIGPGAGIWFNCVLRGDVHGIRVGANSNIQDGTVVHVTRGRYATHIGAHVTIGHCALIHGCRLEDNSFVGMGAMVMDGAVVESGAMVAAGSLVAPRKRVKTGELWAGRPAIFLRRLTAEDLAGFADVARHYAGLGAEYRQALAASQDPVRNPAQG